MLAFILSLSHSHTHTHSGARRRRRRSQNSLLELAINSRGGGGGVYSSTVSLISVLNGSWSTSYHFNKRPRKDTYYPLYRGVGRPQRWKISPPAGIWLLDCPASCYTDCANPAHPLFNTFHILPESIHVNGMQLLMTLYQFENPTSSTTFHSACASNKAFSKQDLRFSEHQFWDASLPESDVVSLY